VKLSSTTESSRDASVSWDGTGTERVLRPMQAIWNLSELAPSYTLKTCLMFYLTVYEVLPKDNP